MALIGGGAVGLVLFAHCGWGMIHMLNTVHEGVVPGWVGGCQYGLWMSGDCMLCWLSWVS